jgi:hypothetical protein
MYDLLFLLITILPGEQNFVNGNGKHMACGEQHELITHTEASDAQLYVILSHDSSIEHNIPGAQYLVLLIVR